MGDMNSKVAEIKARFKAVEKTLTKKPWFKKDKWIVSVHCFPNDKSPDAVTFHVFKKHWYNEDRGGIHVESFLSLAPKKQKKTYVTLHLLHTPKIPGTDIKRNRFSEPFVDEIYNDVKKWPGYTFRAGRYGTQPFTKLLDGTLAEFDKVLTTEVTRICTQLGPVLDKHLNEILMNK